MLPDDAADAEDTHDDCSGVESSCDLFARNGCERSGWQEWAGEMSGLHLCRENVERTHGLRSMGFVSSLTDRTTATNVVMGLFAFMVANAGFLAFAVVSVT